MDLHNVTFFIRFIYLNLQGRTLVIGTDVGLLLEVFQLGYPVALMDWKSDVLKLSK